MLKVMAVLRTLFLAGIAGYLVWALPLGILFSGSDTRDAACFKVVDIDKISSGAWFAVAWIAMETVLGWTRVWLAARKAASTAAPAPGQPSAPTAP